MVDCELDQEVGSNDEHKEQRTLPANEIDAKKDAGKKTVDHRSGDGCLVRVPEMCQG